MIISMRFTIFDESDASVTSPRDGPECADRIVRVRVEIKREKRRRSRPHEDADRQKIPNTFNIITPYDEKALSLNTTSFQRVRERTRNVDAPGKREINNNF